MWFSEFGASICLHSKVVNINAQNEDNDNDEGGEEGGDEGDRNDNNKVTKEGEGAKGVWWLKNLTIWLIKIKVNCPNKRKNSGKKKITK